VLDLSAGSGAFGTVLPHVFPDAHRTGLEIRGEEAWWLSRNYDRYGIGDFTRPRRLRQYDIVATNPPFGLWEEAVRVGMGLLKTDGVLILLGLTSWGSRSRAGLDVFAQHEPALQLRITGTVGFHGRGKGSDVRDYCWWIWTKDKDRIGKEDFWITFNLPRLEASDRTWVAPPGRETGYGTHVKLCSNDYLLRPTLPAAADRGG